MSKLDLTIYVNDNPDNGICNVADHFDRNWNKETLHPKAAACEVDIDRDASLDCIKLVDECGELLLELFNNEALRLDKLQEFIVNI